MPRLGERPRKRRDKTADPTILAMRSLFFAERVKAKPEVLTDLQNIQDTFQLVQRYLIRHVSGRSVQGRYGWFSVAFPECGNAGELQEKLETWAQTHDIMEPWVLDTALIALDLWHRSSPEREVPWEQLREQWEAWVQAHQDELKERQAVLDEVLGMLDSLRQSQGDQTAPRQLILGPIAMGADGSKIVPRFSFEASGAFMDGMDYGKYLKRLETEVKQALKEHRAVIMGATYPILTVTKRDIRWLAERVAGRPENLIAMNPHVDVSTVRRSIVEAAKLIGLHRRRDRPK